MATPKKFPKDPVKRSPTKALNFLEELLWVFERFGISQAKEYVNEVKKELNSVKYSNFSLDEFTPKNPNQLFLIGILPTIFTNTDLFSSNKELAEFSKEILNIDIPRWNKQSRNEIIGQIICSISIADDVQLETIALALKKLQSDNIDTDKFLKIKIQEEKKSWNEIIQILVNNSYA